MKILLLKQADQRSGETVLPGNEVLRLAAEIFEGTGDCPTIDLAGARLEHWNGRKISLDRTDLDELLEDGLLDSNGQWTRYGGDELARHAGLGTPEALKERLA